MCPGFEIFFLAILITLNMPYARNDQLNILNWVTPIKAETGNLMHRDPILGLEK